MVLSTYALKMWQKYLFCLIGSLTKRQTLVEPASWYQAQTASKYNLGEKIIMEPGTT